MRGPRARGGERARGGGARRPLAQFRPPAQSRAQLCGAPATPLRAALTSAWPQTQPDWSAQASGPTLSVPGPWKRRRPARDARKSARSSSLVNVCRSPGDHRSQPEDETAPECSEATGLTGWEALRGAALRGKGAELRPQTPPRPARPAHLAQSPDAADAHRAGARAETHPEGGVGREDDVVVATGHALGVHGEETVRRVSGAPQARVVPAEAVGVAEERGAAWASARP